MSNATQEVKVPEISNASIRKQVRTISPEDFTKAHTKDQLAEKAAIAGVTEEAINGAKTKGDLTDLIYAQYPAPNPALRGKSSVDSPVAYVWIKADTMLRQAQTAASESGEEFKAPRRSEVVNACIKDGVAPYTARTQYQLWFQATARGTKHLENIDLSGLPKKVQAELSPEDESEA